MLREILVLIALVPLVLKAQVTYHLPPKQFYKSGTITLENFTKYQFENLTFKSDSAFFINESNGQTINLSLADVDYVRVKNGNHLLPWTGFGALIGAMLAVVNISANSKGSEAVGLVVTTSAISAVFGGVIGLVTPKMKTYYLSD